MRALISLRIERFLAPASRVVTVVHVFLTAHLEPGCVYVTAHRATTQTTKAAAPIHSTIKNAVQNLEVNQGAFTAQPPHVPDTPR